MAASPPFPPLRRSRERGQATVETVGIIVAIAILLAATGAFLSGSITLPRPPDLIGAIAKVFGRDAPEGRRPAVDVPGTGGYVRLDHGEITPETDPFIGRRLGQAVTPVRAAGAAVVDGVVATGRFAVAYGGLPLACGRAFWAGFRGRVEERALALLKDPRQLLREAMRIARDPDEALRLLPNPMDAVRDVRRALSGSWRDRALNLSRLAGRTAADVAIERLTNGGARLLRQRLAKGRAPKRPVPTAPRGTAPRELRAGDAVVMR